MKITYTPNPLRTVIELDEHEQKELWYKIKIEEMVERLFSVHYELCCKSDAPDIESIKRDVEPDYYLNEKDDQKTPVDKRCDEMLEHYLAELKGTHIGDCTCFAMSCSKCHAEDMLGINTIKGLGKHPGHKIQSAFSYKDGEIWKDHSIEEALESLRDYDPTPSGPGWDKLGGYEQYVPRWKEEAKHAYEWLLDYRNTKLST